MFMFGGRQLIKNIYISLVYKKPFHFSIGTRCFEASHNLLKHSEKFPSVFGYNLIFVKIRLCPLEGVKVPPLLIPPPHGLPMFKLIILKPLVLYNG